MITAHVESQFRAVNLLEILIFDIRENFNIYASFFYSFDLDIRASSVEK